MLLSTTKDILAKQEKQAEENAQEAAKNSTDGYKQGALDYIVEHALTKVEFDGSNSLVLSFETELGLLALDVELSPALCGRLSETLLFKLQQAQGLFKSTE